MEVEKDQKKKTNKYVLIGCLSPVLVGFFIFLIALFDTPSKGYSNADIKNLSDSLSISTDSAESILAFNVAREKAISASFSGLYGYHNGLKNAVVQSLKDPDSFEHIGTQYWDKKDHLVVLMKYRAKNSFGGYVVSSVRAKVSLDGSQIQILD
tara:strand:- start:752 stop:1210 length:459 start_codon:yes stop_codon:yes gene_type:complete